mgnify:CR=1 FL=1
MNRLPTPSVLAATLLLAAAAALTGCESRPEAQASLDLPQPPPGAVSGVLMVQDGASIEDNAVALVKLVERASGTPIASTEVRGPALSPVAFRVDYPEEAIDPEKAYVIEARVVRGGRLAYIAREDAPVITEGAARSVALELSAVQ